MIVSQFLMLASFKQYKLFLLWGKKKGLMNKQTQLCQLDEGMRLDDYQILDIISKILCMNIQISNNY